MDTYSSTMSLPQSMVSVLLLFPFSFPINVLWRMNFRALCQSNACAHPFKYKENRSKYRSDNTILARYLLIHFISYLCTMFSRFYTVLFFNFNILLWFLVASNHPSIHRTLLQRVGYILQLKVPLWWSILLATFNVGFMQFRCSAGQTQSVNERMNERANGRTDGWEHQQMRTNYELC